MSIPVPPWDSTRRRIVAFCVVTALALATPVLARTRATQPLPAAAREAGLHAWLSASRNGLEGLTGALDAELARTGTQVVLRLYLDNFEPIESWYGVGAPWGREPLASLVAAGETRFHEALTARDPKQLRTLLTALRDDLERIGRAADDAGVPLTPPAAVPPVVTQDVTTLREARTPEVAAVLEKLTRARAAYSAGHADTALALVEDAYLQGFEPLEARLPADARRDVESLIHLRLRPLLARGGSQADVLVAFTQLRAALLLADQSLAGAPTFWFGAANAFVIIVREGLEAVLLIAAILAYLAGIGAAPRERYRIFAGMLAGVLATFATWGLARTLVPVSGAGREMMEGVTALLAVAVLLYVSNWLFQKTYIHDWKNYLRSQVGRAVTTGSALAMASLAFAAVYREGFETVLFYQALLFDSSASAVLAGFLPGLLLIVGIGAAILRMGVKLPLRRLFAVTNTILLYLAFVFIGKGIYNLQEAGLFSPQPLAWVPDHPVLRQLLGLYPMAQTVLAQLAFLALLLATYVFYRRRMRGHVHAPAGPSIAAPPTSTSSAASTVTNTVSSTVRV